jgi:cytochrome b
LTQAAPAAPPSRVRIWDWPTRIFHWLLVLLIPALWWTAENGRIELHVTLGLTMLALLLFRLLWGLIGSSTARFANFLKGPRGVVSYLNGRAVHVIGHNPLGGWSVAAMLMLLCVQVGLGLLASDEDGLVMGPLALWVDADTSEWATKVHHLLFNPLLALIALHVVAILFYALVKRRKLVAAMLTGTGAAPEGTAPMAPAPLWRLLVAVAIPVAISVWLWTRL